MSSPDATANANLAARLPYLFACCRFAHYLKCIVRDKVGSFKERAEMERCGWDALDVLLITGDAYVDHPSFGIALIGRILLGLGFRTGGKGSDFFVARAQPFDGAHTVQAVAEGVK